MALGNRYKLGASIAALTSAFFASAASAEPITYERLLNPEPGNWLTHNRTYDSNRYSPLGEINQDTVGDLKIAFALPLAPNSRSGFGGGLTATPLVDDGIMYMVDGMGAVYRIDVSGGHRAYINWIMDPQVDPEEPRNHSQRGVAVLGETVYSLVTDGVTIATDAASGEVLWSVSTQQDEAWYAVAPLALEDKIIIGGGGDNGAQRGRIEALSPEDGSVVWRFWTIPGPGEPGHETWPQDSDVWEVGGGNIWGPAGAFDPDSNTLFFGISNPWPFADPTIRPGDNLYTQSTVALDADTGQLKWYFQYTPNDQWDYDEPGSQQLFTYDGQLRLGHYGRNGFVYVLNATDGTFINGTQYVDELNWTAGLDEKTGLPVEYDPALREGGIQQYANAPARGENAAERVCPAIQGGVDHYPTSYSLRTNLFYASGINQCNTSGFSLATGGIWAVDGNGDMVASATMPYGAYGGTLSTAGGLLFASTVDGEFFAMNDETLEVLWSVNLGTTIEAPPMTYEVDGKQYLALAVGTNNINGFNGGYWARGDDPNAPSVVNSQEAWMMYFFAL